MMRLKGNMTDKKTLTVRDRKKAQPHAVQFLTDAERQTIRQTVAKTLTDPQYSVFIYTCQALGLNPLLNEITAIVYGGQMSIQVMRDGFLSIAHKSGKFAGLESGVKDEAGKKIGWAKVYHKDFIVPVYQEADFAEYNTGKNVWASKPNTMIKKVAESMALRKAFNVNGVYAPEEMEKELSDTVKSRENTISVEDTSKPATPAQRSLLKIPDDQELTFGEAVEKIRDLTKKEEK